MGLSVQKLGPVATEASKKINPAILRVVPGVQRLESVIVNKKGGELGSRIIELVRQVESDGRKSKISYTAKLRKILGITFGKITRPNGQECKIVRFFGGKFRALGGKGNKGLLQSFQFLLPTKKIDTYL